jgi:putative transposase
MCFRLIDAKRAQHPVSLLCSVLGVSRAGYYAWKDRPRSLRARRDEELTAQIRQIHDESEGSYGWPRMHAELRHRGVHASRKRVARLMRAAGLSGLLVRRRGKTTIRVPGVRPAPDLVARDFNPTEPNRLWAADLTEIPTWEGVLNLAVVIDCYSRRVVGWAMAEHRRAELVVEALEMAVWQRKPTVGLVHHSDQGSQYTALIFGQRCHQAGIDRSMGARGCALDNAVVEAFFASLKKEKLNRRSWPTRQAARNAVFAWIEGWYNRRRLHSTLGMRSPVDYENRTLAQDGAGLAPWRLAPTSEMINEKAA